MDAGALEHGAHRATGDDTGTGSGRTQQDDAGGLLALDRVRDGALDPGDLEEGLLGLLDALGDRRGHLLGLAVADADHAVAVADDHEGGEAEATTTLDDLGDTVDRDDALDVGGLVGALPPRRSSRLHGARHRRCPRWAPLMSYFLFSCLQALSVRSERQPALAGAVGQGRDAAVVLVAGAVEDDAVDAGGLGALGDELADLAWPWRSCRRRRTRRSASMVEADASVLPSRSSTTCAMMCLRRPGDDQARTLGRAVDLLAATDLAAQARRRAALRCACRA